MYEDIVSILDWLLIATAIASAFTWIWLLRTRTSKRRPLIEPQERRKPFWTLAEFFVCFGLPIICGLAGLRVGLQWMTPEAQAIIESGKADSRFPAPRDQTVLIVIQFVAMFLAVLSVLVWMNLISLRGLSKYGFWLSRSDIKLGIIAAFLVLPHVLFLNYLINALVAYEHPVLEMFGSQTTWQVLAMQAVMTVLLAPVYEEFTFRALLQGGAEQLTRRMKVSASEDPVGEEMLESDLISPAEVATWSWWPMMISSSVFASLHLAHGGGAIPIFVLALALGYLYRQTGRMGPGLVVHMILNGLSITTVALRVWLEP